LPTCLETTAGRHVGGQVLRSGASPAPNYAEARGAESRADFVHGHRTGAKELNETGIRPLMIQEARVSPEVLITSPVTENRELARILSASIRTARAKGLQRPTDK